MYSTRHKNKPRARYLLFPHRVYCVLAHKHKPKFCTHRFNFNFRELLQAALQNNLSRCSSWRPRVLHALVIPPSLLRRQSPRRFYHHYNRAILLSHSVRKPKDTRTKSRSLLFFSFFPNPIARCCSRLCQM